eukprot:4660977-Amphidinium_carterae.1
MPRNYTRLHVTMFPIVHAISMQFTAACLMGTITYQMWLHNINHCNNDYITSTVACSDVVTHGAATHTMQDPSLVLATHESSTSAWHPDDCQLQPDRLCLYTVQAPWSSTSPS